MSYNANDYANLIGIEGLSDALLNNHFTLYQGYVSNTNKLLDVINQMENDDKTASPEYAELKRRFGWEWNGMRLHELYFKNLAKESEAINQSSTLYQKITSQFGSFEAWEKSFRATGAMRGVGWAILYYDDTNDLLINQWINEHDSAHLAGLKPILVMDVFEHAFMLDYGTKRADYINVFMSHINWPVVTSRF